MAVAFGNLSVFGPNTSASLSPHSASPWEKIPLLLVRVDLKYLKIPISQPALDYQILTAPRNPKFCSFSSFIYWDFLVDFWQYEG
ncbi:hypothetical protein SLEP1_g5103 [Rubroshorea leprosula]|uniref:Uncharacterized protein n=1 Tax=Rubroshorea leprosula TaxID=152421 RepID=A0AAV5I0G1_9ROSI|nr:hypothetical protein SLEP1_g5103 [Rubroshorea leprosula]